MLGGAAHRLGMCKQRVLAACASSGVDRGYSLQPSPCWEATCSVPTLMRWKELLLLPCAASGRTGEQKSAKMKDFQCFAGTGRPCWRGTGSTEGAAEAHLGDPGQQEGQDVPDADGQGGSAGDHQPHRGAASSLHTRVSPWSLAPIRAHCWCVEHAAWTQEETESP